MEITKEKYWEVSFDGLNDLCQTALDALSALESAEARIHNEFALKNIKFCFEGCEACKRNEDKPKVEAIW